MEGTQSASPVRLSDLKESNPVALAEYAVAHDIQSRVELDVVLNG